jgi:hypothetical protein
MMTFTTYIPVDYIKLSNLLLKDAKNYLLKCSSMLLLPILFSGIVTAALFLLVSYLSDSLDFNFYLIIIIALSLPVILILHTILDAAFLYIITRRMDGMKTSNWAGVKQAFINFRPLSWYTVIKYNYYLLVPEEVWATSDFKNHFLLSPYDTPLKYFTFVNKLTVPFIILENCSAVEALKKSVALTKEKFLLVTNKRKIFPFVISIFFLLGISSSSYLPYVGSFFAIDPNMIITLNSFILWMSIFLAIVLSLSAQLIESIIKSVIFLCLRRNNIPQNFCSKELKTMLQKLQEIGWSHRN